MQSSADRGVVLAKLDDGDDLLASIEALAAKHRIGNGMVVWAIGMLRDFEVGYFNGREYERETYRNCMELLSLHGTIAAEADPKLHLHVAAAGTDHATVGGHLFRATVCVVNELCLWRLGQTKLDRVLNPRSGLKELVLERLTERRPRGERVPRPSRASRSSRTSRGR